MHRPFVASVVIGAAALAHLVAPPAARAAGFSAARFGGDHGQPALSNGFSVYYNPAALGGVEGTQITVDGSFAIRSLSYTRPSSALSPSNDAQGSNGLYRAANTGDATALDAAVIPYFGVITDFGTKSLRAGFATYVPFGGSVHWNQVEQGASSAQTPGAIDGPQRWHAISARSQTLFNTLALAYRFDGPRLTIGANASLVLDSARTLRAQNADGSDDVYTSNGGLQEGRALLDVSGASIAAGVGLYWEATRFLRFGLSYTSQPGFGTERLKGTFVQQFGTDRTRATPQNIDFLQALPDIARAGVAWRTAPNFELRGDLLLERWSHMKNQCVVLSGKPCNINADGSESSGAVIANFPRNWRDAFRARAGFAYWVEEATEIFGGASFSTPAIPKKTADPLLYDSYAVGASVGVRHAFSRHLYAAVSYNYIYYLPFTIDSGTSQENKVLAPSKSPSADGSYGEQVYFFNANVSYVF